MKSCTTVVESFSDNSEPASSDSESEEEAFTDTLGHVLKRSSPPSSSSHDEKEEDEEEEDEVEEEEQKGGGRC